MISAGEFRNGVTFEQDGQVLQVVEFQHVKPGKGAAFFRTKTKNVITGSVVETSYNPTAKFPQAFIERKDVTYSYEDGDLYHFMDNETYDDIPVNAADESLRELSGGVVAGLDHRTGDDVLGLGADKGSALAGLDVLELNDLKNLAVLLKGHAIAKLACRNHWNSSINLISDA